MILPPEASRAIVNLDGTMTEPFRRFTTSVAQRGLFTGAGSPEGVVEALPGQEYMDTTGTAGNIKYIKRDADVAGDKAKGWILI